MTKREKDFSLPFSGEWFLLMLTTVLLAGALFGAWRSREIDAFLREELLRSTRVLAETIDVRDVRALSGSARDVGTPQYESFKTYFRSIIQAFPESRFLTLVGRRYDGRVFFYVDSEPPGSKDESPPGEVYDAVDPGFLPAFDEARAVVAGPVEDQWGTWVSAWVPLIEPGSDRVRAVLALDVSGDEWQRRLDRAKLLPALTALLLTGLLFAGRFLIERRSRMEGRRYSYLEFALVLTFGLVLTASVAWMVHERENRSHAHAFSIIAEARSARMNDSLRNLRQFVLEGTSRFIEARTELDFSSFRTYAQHLSSAPEIGAIIWSPAVAADRREEFESVVRDEWRRPLEIGERDASGAMKRAGERAIYFPVLFRSPMTGSEFSAGEDLFSFPEIRKAIRTAEKSGRASAVFFPLQRGRNASTALLVCRPLFSSVFGDSLKGVVLALFLPDRLPYEVLPESDDVTIARFEALFPEAPSQRLGMWNERNDSEGYVFVRPLFAFDRAFAASLRPGQSFLKYHRARTGWFTAASGGVVTIALALFVAFSANRREILEEIVEQRTSELRRSEARHRLAGQIYRSLSEGVVVTDPEGYILDGNEALERLTGYPLGEILGKRPGMFSAQRKQGEDSLRFWEYLREHGAWQGETWNRRKDGSAYPVWLTVNAVKDENGDVSQYAGVLTDIGDIKSEQQRLSHLAYHDSLTGLPNRLLLADRLEMTLARSRRERTYVATLFLDLDGFKEINDTYGHETGDVLLASIARRLSETVREQDTVARLGGDEFVLVFDGLGTLEEAQGLRGRIEALFSEPFNVGEFTLLCSVSAGLAVHRPGDGATAQDLISAADTRMYEEKARRKSWKALSADRA